MIARRIAAAALALVFSAGTVMAQTAPAPATTTTKPATTTTAPAATTAPAVTTPTTTAKPPKASTKTTTASTAAAKPSPTNKVNLNTATSEQLDALPQIGKARLKVIMTERAKSPFKDWDDFDKRMDKTSVNAGVRAKIKDLVTF
jgi:DNA uptake protein ComE-like DNA-binding protein